MAAARFFWWDVGLPKASASRCAPLATSYHAALALTREPIEHDGPLIDGPGPTLNGSYLLRLRVQRVP
jgi:hypothetical protein